MTRARVTYERLRRALFGPPCPLCGRSTRGRLLCLTCAKPGDELGPWAKARKEQRERGVLGLVDDDAGGGS